MRVTRPRKRPLVHHDGNIVLAEQRNEVADRRIGRDRLEPRHHHVLHRAVEALARLIGVGEQRGEQIAFVDQADDLVVLDHRKLRHVGGAHPRKHSAQRVLRPHLDGAAFLVAVDDEIAHRSRARALDPALLRQERIVEHLGEIFRAGIADQAHHALGLALKLAVTQRRREQRARRRAGEDALLAQQVARGGVAFLVGDRIGRLHQREIAIRRHEILADALDGPASGLDHLAGVDQAARAPSRPDRPGSSRSSATRAS